MPLFAGSYICVTNLETHETVQLCGEGISWSPAWNQDGSILAFYTASDKGEIYLYLWDVATNEQLRVSEYRVPSFWYWHPVMSARWLDSERLCTAICYDARSQSVTSKPKPAYEEPGRLLPGVTAREFHWDSKDGALPPHAERQDRVGIAIINVRTNEDRVIKTSFWNALLVPSPDGELLAVCVRDHAATLEEFRFSEQLYMMDLAQMSKPRLVAGELLSMWVGGVRHAPVWSPDSGTLAFINGTEVCFWRRDEGRISVARPGLTPPIGRPWFCLWSSDGDGVVVLHGRELSIVYPDGAHTSIELMGKKVRGVLRRVDEGNVWSPNGDDFIVSVVDDVSGNHGLLRVSSSGRGPELLSDEQCTIHATALWTGGGVLSDISADGKTIVYGIESPNQPSELWVSDGNLSRRSKASRVHEAIARFPIDRIDVVTWEDSRGIRRRGILAMPSTQSARPVPLVVSVYPGVSDLKKLYTWGLGTANAIVPPQLLAAHGYAVFVPELFPADGDFPDEVTKELLLATRAALHGGPFDEDRVAVMGHSFGGYTVNCVITRTTVFRAAISSGGYGNIAARYAASSRSDDTWVDGDGAQVIEAGQLGIGAPWENPQGYIDHSPIFFLDRVETPLLLVGGGDDGLYQPHEMFVGLTRLGNKVRCLRYAGEGHVPSEWSRANQIHLAEQVLAWLRETME